GHLLLGVLSSGAHVELVEDPLRLCPPPYGVLAVTQPRREGAEAQPAGRDERTQPQRFGEAQRLFVALARLLRVRGGAARGDVAEHLERLRLVAALTVLARHVEGLARGLEPPRILTVRQVAFSEIDEPGGEVRADAELAAHRDAVLEQAEPFVHVAHANEREAEQRQRDRQPYRQVFATTRFQAALERQHGTRQPPATDPDEPDQGPGDESTVGVLGGLGGALRLGQIRVGRVERAAVSEAEREPAARGDVRDRGLVARGRLDVLSERALGARVIALRVIALTH